MGYNFSFRKGIKEANGDIIFFSDQDDIWIDLKIEKILKYFKSKQDVSVVINDCFFLREGKVSRELTKAQTIKNFSGTLDHFVAGCCTAFDRVILDAVNHGLYEDLNYDDQIHKIGKLLNRRFFYNEVLQLYRRHSENESKIPQNDGGKVSYFRMKYNKLHHELIQYFYIDLIVMNKEEQKTFSIKLSSLYKSDMDLWSSQFELINQILLVDNKIKFSYLLMKKNWNSIFLRVFLGVCIIQVEGHLKKYLVK